MKDALKVWQCLSIIWFFFFFFGKFCLCARCLSLFWEESPPSAILLSILWSDLWLYYLGDKMKDEMKSMKRQSFQYILLLLKVKKKKSSISISLHRHNKKHTPFRGGSGWCSTWLSHLSLAGLISSVFSSTKMKKPSISTPFQERAFLSHLFQKTQESVHNS